MSSLENYNISWYLVKLPSLYEVFFLNQRKFKINFVEDRCFTSPHLTFFFLLVFSKPLEFRENFKNYTSLSVV